MTSSPYRSVKTVALSEEVWQALILLKSRFGARSMDNVVRRVLREWYECKRNEIGGEHH